MFTHTLRPARRFANSASTLPKLPKRAISYTPQFRLKEDGNRSPEEIESEKQSQLRKQKEGKGEWHESLASSSEAGVKADQEKVQDHGKHMKKLQEETAAKSQGKS
ncbi:hypothetical protein EJ05DRAFT_114495 [Pseudovirgaria hyperparasitica]|uniref:Mitochondrial carrier n=1 Tax=Pseudovirgaria hyperparasitica TaxID=470096 RepID=A0A6A6W0Z3_9PEZI|nr:uncharacterized protein EJ05DRAFT_114495 [Pseudovirgaria hyperparasitica]KAF2755766.1 hypothetical protein EJ05DRAFT_114495 [Pseudovirgaria hyperparasitica]